MGNWAGGSESGFSAIDVGERFFVCTCGKPTCPIVDHQPVRNHIALLYRALVSCDAVGALRTSGCEDSWSGVAYTLAMAGSIENVLADPYYVDDSQAGYWCGTAWEREEEDRATASRYVAALMIFNFVWLAYESVIAVALGSPPKGDKPAVQARKLLSLENPKTCESAIGLVLTTFARLCKSTSFEHDVDAVSTRHSLTGAAAGAEFGRLFRNYIVHGNDPPPADGLSSYVPIYHFYAASKLMLLLIQVLAVRSLKDDSVVVAPSVNSYGNEERALWLLSNLHLRKERWMGLDPSPNSGAPV